MMAIMHPVNWISNTLYSGSKNGRNRDVKTAHDANTRRSIES